MSYFAVLLTTHVRPVPRGLTEPTGIFPTLDAALEYLRETEERWTSEFGHFPHAGNIRINEYATRRVARTADVSDGFIQNGRMSGAKPLSITSR